MTPRRFHANIRVARSAKTDTGQAPTTADIYIYDPIGQSYWEERVSAKSISQQINELDVDEIHVFINSPGGDAWDGLAIMNALRRHRASVTVTVDALAASAASVIAMAGDRVVMNRGAELMIHDPWTWAEGNAQDLMKLAETLDKLGDSYADAYAARAGGSREQFREAMRAETWYSAEEAVTAGLADEWVDAPAAAAHVDVIACGFRYTGRAQAPAPRMLPASEPGEEHDSEVKENPMSEMLSEGLRQRLGLADSTADAEILAALDERLTVKPAAPEIPEGMALIDAAILDELRAENAKAAEARAAFDAQRRDALVDQALKDGRIAPASRDRMRALLDADEEGATALLESLAPNTIPVSEVGIGEDSKIESDEDRLYHAAWPGADEKKEA